jgi:GT2 family glycosyltransferase
LYRPYYYEDVDLGYQAWVRGWRVVYEPESVMYHKSSATLAVYERAESLRAAEVRNNLLVTWKNSDNETLRLNLSRCARRLIGSIARGDREFVRAVAGALARSGEVLRRRRQLNRVRVRSDREIDEIIFANCPLPSTEA